DNGALAVGRFYRDPPIEMLNTAALGVDALSRRGIADPFSHLVVLRYRDFGLLIVREEPFDVASANAIRRFAADHHFTVAFDPLAVGFGFIAAEIVLLQRLTLYLGQPALALAVGLAALLVGAAGGSAASTGGRIGVARAALASAIVVTVAFLAFDRVAVASLSWPLIARGVVACVVSIAIGLPLGSVFPTVIASAGAHDDG